MIYNLKRSGRFYYHRKPPSDVIPRLVICVFCGPVWILRGPASATQEDKMSFFNASFESFSFQISYIYTYDSSHPVSELKRNEL